MALVRTFSLALGFVAKTKGPTELEKLNLVRGYNMTISTHEMSVYR